MILLHLALCLGAVLATWRKARPVALAVLAVAVAIIAAEFTPPWPWRVLWQLVGPVAVANAAWATFAAPAVIVSPALWFSLVIAAPLVTADVALRTALAAGLAVAHAEAFISGWRAARRRPPGELTPAYRLAAVLVASSAGGAVGAACWGIWGTRDVAAISDTVFLTILIAGGVAWTSPRE